MLSDKGIKKELGKGIIIKPRDELDNCLTPVGYDLRVGKYGFSWKGQRKVDIHKEGHIRVEPNDTVVIQTYEYVKLSKGFSATLHSRATLVLRRGLSHISTTIDPGWEGTLLISIHNHLNSVVCLDFKQTFCTACFYRVEPEAEQSPRISPNRDDVWRELLDKAREEQERIDVRKSKERITRISLGIAYTVLAVFISIGIYFFINPNLSTIVGTILVSPLIYDILKDILKLK